MLAFGTLPLPLLEWPFKSSAKADSMKGGKCLSSWDCAVQAGHTARALFTSYSCHL